MIKDHKDMTLDDEFQNIENVIIKAFRTLEEYDELESKCDSQD